VKQIGISFEKLGLIEDTTFLFEQFATPFLCTLRFQNMRLTQFERHSVMEVVKGYLPDARVLLFGSRVDDAKRGGDIDLLVLANTQPDWRLKWRISDDIQQRIGEQKIDVVIENENELSTFGRMVLEEAIPLDK
jgi:uncharacterized protein